jgi:hypothetical protein
MFLMPHGPAQRLAFTKMRSSVGDPLVDPASLVLCCRLPITHCCGRIRGSTENLNPSVFCVCTHVSGTAATKNRPGITLNLLSTRCEIVVANHQYEHTTATYVLRMCMLMMLSLAGDGCHQLVCFVDQSTSHTASQSS